MNMRHTNQKAWLVIIQRSQCWHLQRVTCNKDFRCTITDSALDLKMGPKDKTQTRKNRKNTLTREEKRTLLIT
jgi:hypothetical protein